VIVGRLIPAGTGFAHHEDRRRTQEDILAAELQDLSASLTRSAEAEFGGSGVAVDAEPADTEVEVKLEVEVEVEAADAEPAEDQAEETPAS
jgi:hypothetical protein